MVAQNSPRRFLAKMDKFFKDNNLPERHRSGVAQVTLRYRSGVAQDTAQVGSTGRLVSRPDGFAGLVSRTEKVARPGASCEFSLITA
jgi:hypothetical protein